MNLRAIALSLLLIVPGAAALEGTDATVGVVQYHLEAFVDHAADITTASAGEFFNHTFNASKPHDYEVLASELIFEITITATVISDSAGVWNITFALGGVDIPECGNHIRTFSPGGFLEADLVIPSHYALRCESLNNQSLNNLDHNQVFTGDVQVDSGSPSDIAHMDTSLRVFREDTYMVPQDANEIMQTLTIVGPFLFAVAFVFMARKMDDLGSFVLLTLLAVLSAGTAAMEGADIPGYRLTMIGFVLAILINAYNDGRTFWSSND